MGRDKVKRSELVEAPLDIQCVDVWNPRTFGSAEARAYKRAADDGLLKAEKLLVSRATGAVTVRYLSSAPQKWIHKALADYVRDGEQMCFTMGGAANEQ